MSGWVCEPCGRAHGKGPARVDEFTFATCEICGERAFCAAPSDFGGLKPDLPPQPQKGNT